MHENTLNRRQVLAGAGALGAAALSSTVFAAGHGKGEHGHHGAHGHHQGHQHGATPEHSAVFKAARHCVSTAEVCLDHCLMLFQAGDTSVADCAMQVNLMGPVSDALAKHANANSTHLKALATVAIDVYQDCETACLEHADEHAECKWCAESCTQAIKACQMLLET